jgi:alpha-beta hydrolase superfamily lysophospholipase
MKNTALEKHLAPPMPSYEGLEHWKRYGEFFAGDTRLSAAPTPQEQWWSYDGLDIHLDRLAVPSSKLKVIVLHGAGAYGRVMAPAAEIARQHGFETVSPDLPGYGLSQVPRARFTYPLWVDCVVALIEAELARDGRPVVLFGVSLGGMLAYHAAVRSRRVAGIAATTLADMRESEVRQGFARTALLGGAGLWLLEALQGLTDGLPLPMRYMSKMDRISNRPALAKVVCSDRLGGGNWVPARFLRTFVNAAPDIEPENFSLCPVLVVHPGKDRMTDIAHTRRFFDRLVAPKRMVILEEASHMPTEQPGVAQMETAVIDFLRGVERGVQ